MQILKYQLQFQIRYLFLIVIFASYIGYSAYAQEEFCCPDELNRNFIPPPTLSLPQAIGYTLENQVELKISELNIQVQKGVLQHTAGPFDPVLEGNARHVYQRNQQYPLAELKSHHKGYENTANLLARKKARAGTVFSLSAQIDQVNNPLIYPLKINIGTISFLVEQPLLREFLYGQDTVTEEAADVELYAVYLDNFQTVSQKILDTTIRYWDAVSAQKIAKINEDALIRLVKLEDNIQELIDKDQLARADIHQPQERIANQQVITFISEQDYYASLQNLKFAMGNVDVWGCDPDNLILADDFPPVKLNLEDFQCLIGSLIYSAINYRYDILASLARQEEADILLKGAYNEVLPQVNVLAGVQKSNFELGGRSKPFFSPYGYHDSETDWTIGMSFSVPFHNDAALGDLRQRKAIKYQSEYRTQLLMQSAVTNLRVALSNQIYLASELDKASERVKLNQTLIDEEHKKLNAGFSSLFILLDFENRLTNALIEHTDIYKQYLQNIANLRFLTGTLFQPDATTNWIKVVDVTTLPGM